jgi:hypothetical protein
MKVNARTSIAFILLFVAVSSIAPVLTPARGAMVLYNSGNPTPDQQLVLEYINRARANPIAEGQRLGIDIHEGLEDDPQNGCYGPEYVGVRPPLAMNPLLLGIAQAHTEDMYNLNYFSHDDPNGTTPFQRMTNAGYNYVSAGEDMAAGTDMGATALEDFMMVDAGTPCRPHRMNLLDIFPYPPSAYLEVGVGYYEGSSGQAFITEDFGTAESGPLLLGVVYNNADGSNFYEAGNGIAGVTITPSTGSYYAVSSSSGGYAIPIGSSGTITVTASGAGFGPVTKTVTLMGTNIKLDFTTNNQETSSSTSIQTSSTSTYTLSDTSTTQSGTTSTAISTTSSQTATNSYVPPSITLATPSAISGSTVNISGMGFASTDTTCSLTGNAAAVMSQSCTISSGDLTASFTVGNVATGSYAVTATGSPLGDLASATLQVTNNTTQTTSTTTSSSMTSISVTSSSVTSTSDFLLVPSTPSVTLSQGASGFDTITVFSLNGFNASVALFTTWLGSSPSGVEVSVTSPLTPAPGGETTSQLTMSANSTASPGSFTVRITGMSGTLGHTVSTDINVRIDQSAYTTTQTSVTSSAQTTASVLTTSTSSTATLSLPSEPTSCVVSSSTAGSDLEPLVQKLRTFRDESILKSKTARSFMILFNAWYYSFSPQIAASISTHPTERAFLKDGMYPLVAVLYTSYYTYALISPLGIEGATLMAGIVAALLLGLIYLAPIALVVKWVLRRHTKFSLRPKGAILWVGISFLAFGLSYPLGSQVLGAAAANLVLSMVTLAALAGSVMLRALANMIARTVTKWPLVLGVRPFGFALTPPGLESEH